jgi:hypothetical protein
LLEFNYVGAALAAAAGIAEIAIASAVSLPTARYGLTDHKGGLVEAGHGRPEMVVLPSGEQFVTPSTPTVYDLPSGTNIYPDADFFMRQARMTDVVVKMPKQAETGIDMRKHTKEIVDAIRDKQELHIGAGMSGILSITAFGSKHAKWIQKNVQF